MNKKGIFIYCNENSLSVDYELEYQSTNPVFDVYIEHAATSQYCFWLNYDHSANWNHKVNEQTWYVEKYFQGCNSQAFI